MRTSCILLWFKHGAILHFDIVWGWDCLSGLLLRNGRSHAAQTRWVDGAWSNIDFLGNSWRVVMIGIPCMSFFDFLGCARYVGGAWANFVCLFVCFLFCFVFAFRFLFWLFVFLYFFFWFLVFGFVFVFCCLFVVCFWVVYNSVPSTSFFFYFFGLSMSHTARTQVGRWSLVQLRFMKLFYGTPAFWRIFCCRRRILSRTEAAGRFNLAQCPSSYPMSILSVRLS